MKEGAQVEQPVGLTFADMTRKWFDWWRKDKDAGYVEDVGTRMENDIIAKLGTKLRHQFSARFPNHGLQSRSDDYRHPGEEPSHRSQLCAGCLKPRRRHRCAGSMTWLRKIHPTPAAQPHCFGSWTATAWWAKPGPLPAHRPLTSIPRSLCGSTRATFREAAIDGTKGSSPSPRHRRVGGLPTIWGLVRIADIHVSHCQGEGTRFLGRAREGAHCTVFLPLPTGTTGGAQLWVVVPGAAGYHAQSAARTEMTTASLTSKLPIGD